MLINAFAIYWVTKPGEGARDAEGLGTRTGEGMMRPGEGTTGGHAGKERPAFESGDVAPEQAHRALQDKDAYLRPQANVYHPMGNGLGTYDDNAQHTLPYVDAPPVIPEPLRLPTARASDVPYGRHSSSYGSSTPMQPRVTDVEVRSGPEARDDGEIGFADFLTESQVGLPRGPAERRRNSQEEEGKFQKAFFNLLLGRVKMPTAGVGVS